MSPTTVKLPGNSELLLRGYPASEPDFEEQARAITARIASDEQGDSHTTAQLLQPPPLPREAGEPVAVADLSAATAPRATFTDIARKSLRTKDDGAELAKEMLAATAHRRRPNAEFVERVRAAGRPAAGDAVAPAAVAAAEEAPRQSGVVARLAPDAPPRRRGGAVLAVASVLLAVAAGAVLYLSRSDREAPAQATLEAAPARADAAPQRSAATAPLRDRKGDSVVSPESLATLEQEPRSAALPPASPATTAPPATAMRSGSSSVTAATKPAVKSAAAAAKPAPSEGAVAALATEPKGPPASPEPALRPAEGHTDGAPLTPSLGAVGTALSSVRGNAQACLAGQGEPVVATVTFASDGRVLKVSASGPSSSCVQAALSKARITPFARETYSATTTIRPP
jgi:hypothetical protein